jgi:hypothetical protein
MAGTGSSIDAAGKDGRRDLRNRAVKAAWLMLAIGLFSVMRPLIAELPSLFTVLGLSSFTSLYFLAGLYADQVTTLVPGALMVVGAVAVMRGKAGWLWCGTALLTIDLILLALAVALDTDMFFDMTEAVLALAVRVATWWMVLRGSFAARRFKRLEAAPGAAPAAGRKPRGRAVESVAPGTAVVADAQGVPPVESVSVPASRFCSHCGGALGPDARFCPSCGSAVRKVSEAPAITLDADDTAVSAGTAAPSGESADGVPGSIKAATGRAASGEARHRRRPAAPPAAASGKVATARWRFPRGAIAVVGVVAMLVVVAFLLRDDIAEWIESADRGGLVQSGSQQGARATLDRTESPASGSRAVDIEPVPGFRIQVAENGLDRDRSFRVRPLGEREIGGIADAVPPDFTPMNAYHLDAGMAADETAPGHIRLSFDLDQLGVDEVLWDSMAVMRIDGDERDFLASSVIDGRLVAYTRKNSVIVTGTLLTIATAVGTYAVTSTRNGWYGKYLRDEPAYRDMVFRHVYYPSGSAVEMIGSTESVSWESINEVVGDKHYRLAWPVTLQSADPDEVRRTSSELALLLDKYGLGESGMIVRDAAERRNARLAAQIRLKQDPDYRELMRTTVGDPKWIRERLWPAEVRATAEALDIADSYLFKDRKVRFERPWNVTDILILAPRSERMTSQTYAMEVDLSFTAPYIMVNAAHNSIPASAREFAVEGKRFGIENLALTLVHEMVHVLQDSVGLPDLVSKEYLWLYEAEAVLVENEAHAALKGKVLHGDYTTDRSSWHTLVNSLDAAVDQGTIDQNRGYVASRFLEYLRDRYYAGNPDAFAVNLRGDLSNYLPQLAINRLSGSELRSTTLDAVVRQTSSSWRELATQYTQFCLDNTADMLGEFRHTRRGSSNKPLLEAAYRAAHVDPGALLSPARPLYTLKSRPGEQLSVSFTELRIEQLSAEQRDRAQLALLTPRYPAPGSTGVDQIRVSWSDGVSAFRVYDIERGVTVPVPASGEFYLRQIHDYSNTAGIVGARAPLANEDRSRRHKDSDILLLTPIDAPKLERDSSGERLVVRWRDGSALRALKREDGSPYLTHYRVAIQHSAQESPLQFTPDRDRLEVQVLLSDLAPDAPGDDRQPPEDYTLSVTVRQVIADHPGSALLGPDSEATRITIPAQPPSVAGDDEILGHWNLYSTYSNKGQFAPPGLSPEGLARWNAERGITGDADSRRFHVVFERDGTFYAEVRSAEGIIDVRFRGTYVANRRPTSRAEFIYLADIDPASVVNSGPMPYRQIRDDGPDLKFYFVQREGKRLLYEENGQHFLE